MNDAMRINGQYLEDLIPGYTTLGVNGRETLDMDIDSVKLKRSDGERFLFKSKNAREIVVYFCLFAQDMADFDLKFQKLKAALNVNEAQLIFDDAPHKYWTGTPVSLEAKYHGTNATKGEITIICHDPVQHGLVERVVPFIDGVAEIYYSGTEETRPQIHAVFPEDTGYISFTKDEKTLMFGDETDDGSIPTDPDSVFEYVFNSGLPEAGERWSYNDGTLPALSAAVAKTGAMGLTTWTPANLRLYAESFGTDNDAWHGPSISYHLHGTKDEWTVTVYHRQEATANDQRGMMQIALTDEDGNSVASCRFVKSTPGTMDSGIDIFVGGTKKKTVGFQMIKDNPITGPGVTTITKKGGTITFSFNGTSYQFTDSSLADVEVKVITLYLSKWKNTAYINTSYITGFRFTSPDESVTVRTFWSGDMIDVDCESAEVQVNDVPTYQIGRITNPWDSFKLTPGKNVITMDRSDWAAMPSAYVTYREAFT